MTALFMHEELQQAASVPLTDAILLHAMRLGTQAFAEFGRVVIRPAIEMLLQVTEREEVFGLTFYRLLASVQTLSEGGIRIFSRHLVRNGDGVRGGWSASEPATHVGSAPLNSASGAH
jgi:hypothetical protein